MIIPQDKLGFNIYWHPAKRRIVDAEGRFYSWRNVTPYLNNLKKCEP